MDNTKLKLLATLATASELELRFALTMTDNEKFKKILKDTLAYRFP